MSLIMELLRAMMTGLDAAQNGGQAAPSPAWRELSPRTRNGPRMKRPPQAPQSHFDVPTEPVGLILPEEPKTALTQLPPRREEVRRNIQAANAPLGIIWSEILGQPRATKPWSPR